MKAHHLSHCQDRQDYRTENAPLLRRDEVASLKHHFVYNVDGLYQRFGFSTRSATMATTESELNELFAIPPVTELPPDVHGELRSILRLHSISPQELLYKWESYTMKMGSEQTKLGLETARAFKKDLQEMLERDSRGKAHLRSVDKRGAFATPRSAAKGDDVFGM